jgi:hypothetical protein
MAFWVNEIERDTVIKLADGFNAPLEKAEKNSIFEGWKRDSILLGRKAWAEVKALAEQEIYPHPQTSHYAAIAASYSSRWDIWTKAIDMAHNPPHGSTDKTAQHIANTLNVYAILCRRNQPIQNTVNKLHTIWQTLDTQAFRPDFYAMEGEPTAERLRQATKALEIASYAEQHAIAREIGCRSAAWTAVLHKATAIKAPELRNEAWFCVRLRLRQGFEV